jgi:hypothetical protein
LASIHGRLNILKFLIEERHVDVNLPSSENWFPIHLCISNQIGERATLCLEYLITRGANLTA